MRQHAARLTLRRLLFVAALVVTVITFRLVLVPAYGAQLQNRSLTFSSGIVDKTGTQKLRFELETADVLGSIAIRYCANSPLFSETCVPPAGLDARAAALSAQTGETGFSIRAADTTVNQLVLTRPPATNELGQVEYTLDGIKNPSATGSYFVRVETFASEDATGSATHYGAIAFAINADMTVSAEVPPYLIFCTGTSISTFNCTSATGNYINFGELSSSRAIQASSQMLAATNAKSGYNISITGTTLMSGNNVIEPLARADVSRPGNSQFGLNLRANSAPAGGSDPAGPGSAQPLSDYGQANFFRFVNNDVVVSVDVPDDMRRYTASYLVNVPRSQAPGVYASTVTYISYGNF